MTLVPGDDAWTLRVGDGTALDGSVVVGPETSDAVTLTGITAQPAGPVLSTA